MIKELIYGLVPGSVFIHRYVPRLSVPGIAGIVLMEIVPYCIAALILSVNYFDVLFGFLLVYSIYDIGYLHNDLIAHKEPVGQTVRTQFNKLNIKLFVVIRAPVIFALTLQLLRSNPVNLHLIVMQLISLGLLFILHNLLTNPYPRIFTFIGLNGIKIHVRLILIDPTASIYLFSAIPHLVVKILHYLGTKKIIEVVDLNFGLLKLFIYLGFVPLLLVINAELFLVFIPYFLNHNKRYILDRFRPISRM